VADAYEAMTSHRVYRAAVPPDAARSELLACAGSQFDPMVVAAFVAALRERDEPPRAALVPQTAVAQQPS
jgi:HD-GYP domain-containing protein (c-di-GMP phosphodiesterase class II)